MLTSDIVAASPFRRFLADLPKVQRFGSLITNGEYLPSIDFTIAYDIWQEIEELRTSYFELSINSLKTKVSLLYKKIKKYVTQLWLVSLTLTPSFTTSWQKNTVINENKC